MKVVKTAIPSQSLLATRKFDYFDAYRARPLPPNGEMNVVSAARAVFSSAPAWIGKLMHLRNRMVYVFGLKTGEPPVGQRDAVLQFKGEPGERLGIFKVTERAEQEIIMGEDDKHLDFRVSLHLLPQADGRKELTLTTIVTYNNWFGRLYFFFVKPFHKVIVRAMMRRMLVEQR